jgi:TolB protein
LHAELEIQVTQGRDDALPIAVVPFATPGGNPPQDIGGIVAADLHRSGQFSPLPAEDLLSRPHRAEDMIWRDFRVLGTDYVVAGTTEKLADGGYRVRYGLYDVPRQEKVLSQTYEPEARRLRDVAHAISDKIYEHLTGVPGAFSTRILYVTKNTDLDRPYRLQYADADGRRVQTILRSREPIMSPSWAPDGRRVAYVSFEDDGLPGIYVHDLATAERRKVSSFEGINGAPAWSPDGERLAITLSRSGNPEIYIMELDTGALTQLTDHYGIDTEPRWLPDGESLVFTSNRAGGPQIYRMNTETGNVRRVTFEGGYNARADVTPDGRFLVFVHRMNGDFHVAVKDLRRGTFDVVTNTELDESPSVAPNGSMIIYATQQGGTGILQAVSMDGQVKVKLPSREGEVREPAWSPFL